MTTVRVFLGEFAEDTASRYNFSRNQQEQFVLETLERYQHAQSNGFLDFEIVPIEIKDAKGTLTIVAQDEQPSRVKPEKFPILKPAFKAGSTVTAATSSPL